MEDWDIISTKDVLGSEQHLVERTKTLASAALPFTQSILSQVPPASSRSPHGLAQLLKPDRVADGLLLCAGWTNPVPGPAGAQLVVRRGDEAFHAAAERR